MHRSCIKFFLKSFHSGPEIINIFVLKSAEHETYSAHKC